MTLNRIDLLEKELDRLLKWIAAAESRLTFIFSLSTAMLGTIALSATNVSHWSCIYATATISAIIFLGLSIAFSALATFPRTRGPKRSLIYFGSINLLTVEDYMESATSLTEEEYAGDLIDQCYRNANIATTKFAWVKRAMICIFGASIPWTIAIYGTYLGG